VLATAAAAAAAVAVIVDRKVTTDTQCSNTKTHKEIVKNVLSTH